MYIEIPDVVPLCETKMVFITYESISAVKRNRFYIFYLISVAPQG